MITLSVVLVSRNQDWNLRRLIESVLNKSSPFLSIEAILVDAASTDKTIRTACGYHINVIRLQEDQRLTPSAGRYVGSQYASGAFVLFLDGDMELCEGWLEQALDVLVADPSVGVVSGKVVETPRPPLDNRLHSSKVSQSFPVTDANDYGSSALYRRSVLQTVGTFNPYLVSGEGVELCDRIRRKGYRVVALEDPLAARYSDRSHDEPHGYLEIGKNAGQLLNPDVLRAGLHAGVANVSQWFGSQRIRWQRQIRNMLASSITLEAFNEERIRHPLRELLLAMNGREGILGIVPLQALYSSETSPIKFEVVKFVGITPYGFERNMLSGRR